MVEAGQRKSEFMVNSDYDVDFFLSSVVVNMTILIAGDFNFHVDLSLNLNT